MTVGELQQLLSGTTPGSTFTMNDTALGIDAVKQLFDLTLPSSTLTVDAAQPDAARLSLTGTITVGNANNAPVTVTFSTDVTATTVTGLLIDIVEPDWTIATSFLFLTLSFLELFKFQGLHLLLSAEPDAEGNTAAQAGIGSTLQFNASVGNVTLSLSGFADLSQQTADIALEGSFTGVNMANLAALAQFVTGADFNIPSTIPLASSLELKGLRVVVNPGLQNIVMAVITVGSSAPWTIIAKRFEFESIDVLFAVSLPTASPKVTATVASVLQIDGVDVAASVTIPDLVLTAVLQDQVSLAPFISTYLPGVTIDTFNISQFAMSLDIRNLQYFGAIDITGNWQLAQGVALEELFMTISGQGTSATGQITATFNLGGTDVLIGASYSGPSTGWTFMGSTVGDSTIPIGHLINGALSTFGASLPGPIADLTLSKILLTLTTGDSTGNNRAFNFTCQGTTTVSDVTVQFTPTIALAYDPTAKKWGGVYGGTLVLNAPQNQELTFNVTFSDTPTDMSLKATYSGSELGFNTFAAAIGFTSFPTIPPSLDLGLVSAGFSYDFTTKAMVFGAGSNTYSSNAVFVTFIPKSQTVRQYFFLLAVNQTFSLSKLPLVGEELAQLENIQVGNLLLIIGSETADPATAVAVNALITALFPASYPTLPAAGTAGTFVLTATLTFGSDPLPLSVALGGSSKQQQALLPAVAGANPAGAQIAASSTSDGATWFNVQKSFGPVTFQRIGVMYQSDQQTLWFELDATMAFGPVTMDLVGLGLGSPLSSFEPKFFIKGLGIAYSNPPLTIAGSLTNLSPPGQDYIEFEGGVTIGTGEFTVTAFGYYGNKHQYSSMFIFGDIAYDFGGPPAFFVTGIALGFGYNSNLRIPTIDEVQSFPFVQVLPTSMVPNTGIFGENPTPQAVLDVIMNTDPAWVKPVEGSLWFAAGITFTSFELVNSQALILVQIGNDLVIALVGTSRAQFPQALGKEVPVYAYIELDLLIEFAPMQGVFSVQAVLAKSSFLLDKACVLTGGFAFFVWYGSNPHAGDFVLTLGGYNSGFTPPGYYPTVPQVGFHWSLDSSISISGGAYFALTPAALMVGGELNATYQAGNLKAWFDAHADIIVQWNPFWFYADFGITIGASYKVDLLFTSFTVTVELGCDLEVWGPPTGGKVGVDWYIISFSIPFGASKNSSKPVLNQWSQVQAMLPNTGDSTKPNVLTLAPAAGLTSPTTSPSNSDKSKVGSSLRAAVPGSVRANAAGDPIPVAAPWIVRGGQFSFKTSCSVPASSATVGRAHAFNGSQFNVAPLGWTGISATHELTIQSSTKVDASPAFQVTPSFANVPSQLWGSQSSSTPDGANQLVPNQLVGLSLVVNPPEIGASAGPVNVSVNLASVELAIGGGLIGLSATAQPVGDIAVNSSTTLSVIANPGTGVGSTTAAQARGGILTALGDLGYAPQTKNDPMTNFASQAGSSFMAVPLLVS